jgi:hypothetical protein
MRARTGEFWFSSYREDIKIIEDILVGGDYFTVAGEKFAALFKDSDIHKAVAIVQQDGSEHWARITDIVAYDGNSRVYISPAPSEDIMRDDVCRVSFIYRCRFGSDKIVVQWTTDNVASMKLACVVLPVED